MAEKPLSDAGARQRIETEFEMNFLVEAGAGSGKTRSLARRMAAGIAAGVYDVRRMAAVTFTRKAAAELRGRFQEALEDRRRNTASEEERRNLDGALSDLERLFAGTIHAFCAHLLRERPVEAGVAPGFEELDERDDGERRKHAWREFVAVARAEKPELIQALRDVGVRPRELDGAFAAMCQHQDVDFPGGSAERPDIEPVWKALDSFWARLSALMPDVPDPAAKCPVLPVARDFGPRYHYARRHRHGQPAVLADLLSTWESEKRFTLGNWKNGAQARHLQHAFSREAAAPFLRLWREYVYRAVMPVLAEARGFYAADRARENVVNYVDLLSVAARMLRENAEVRRALQAKFRWLFVDEFQDTDPIQAEVFELLASDDAGRLRPGALFVVGDPKQSIFRFRRADIDIYNRVKAHIRECGGDVLHLTANWRSLASVCELANSVFPARFPPSATRQSPAYERLEATRQADDEAATTGIFKLTIPASVAAKDDTEAWEAPRIARYIKDEVAAGRRIYGSFLILARNTPRLRFYADALDALEIPVEVTGAGRFAGDARVRVLASLLAALADPADGASLVGVLRGPLFGLSDPELYEFRKAGGRFSIFSPVDGEDVDGADRRAALAARYGPVLDALIQVRAWRRLAGRLPLGAAVDQILEDSGWLAIAATSPGGAHAGVLLQAVDCVRAVAEEGGGLLEAAEALLVDEGLSSGAEMLPLEPGRGDVVRVMNLHRAKGLEADVVFLADPAHGYEFPVLSRIMREGNGAAGYLKIQIKYGRRTVVLAHPPGWASHEEEEQAYHNAEMNRLLYVASTRARDLLVVSRWDAVFKKDGSTKNEAWMAFEEFLANVPEVQRNEPDAKAATPAAGEQASAETSVAVPAALSMDAQLAAAAERAARHEALKAASWAVSTPTGEKDRAAASQLGDGGRGFGLDVTGGTAGVQGPTTTGSPGGTERADAGAAWGTLLHGLLEHAMRHADASRDDLARLAQWLTVEHEAIRPYIGEALDVVDSVRHMPFWQEAQAGGEALVEVPFAVRIVPDGGPGLETRGPAVLRGVIDLVYAKEGGWRILDYKSDQLDGMVDVDAEMLARYRPQLEQYKAGWERITSGTVESADLVALRAKRAIGRV